MSGVGQQAPGFIVLAPSADLVIHPIQKVERTVANRRAAVNWSRSAHGYSEPAMIFAEGDASSSAAVEIWNH